MPLRSAPVAQGLPPARAAPCFSANLLRRDGQTVPHGAAAAGPPAGTAAEPRSRTNGAGKAKPLPDPAAFGSPSAGALPRRGGKELLAFGRNQREPRAPPVPHCEAAEPREQRAARGGKSQERPGSPGSSALCPDPSAGLSLSACAKRHRCGGGKRKMGEKVGVGAWWLQVPAARWACRNPKPLRAKGWS